MLVTANFIFLKHLNSANINPLIWTTGRMAPEAYTIHEAINGYLKKEDNEKIRERGTEAYSKYQKCSKKAARIYSYRLVGKNNIK